VEQTFLTTATVIGAGPSGALAAALLARRGIEVTLVDKSSFPRHKVCGCCLSPTAIRALSDAGYAGLPEELGAVPLTEMHLYNGGQRIKLRLQNSFSLSRAKFDNALIEIAQEEGATFISDTTASVGGVEGFRRVVELGESEARSKVVIAADGLGGCSLRKLPELQSTATNDSKIGTGAISQTGASAYESGIIYMCVGGGGYVGLVRLEDNSLDIAAALSPDYLRRMHNPADAITRLLRAAKLPIPSDIHEIEWRGTVGLTRRRAQVAAERLFAIGDCASYVEPFTGEGIAWALIGALNVVPLAERASLAWDKSLAAQWERTYRNEVCAKQKKTAVIAGLLNNNLAREIGAELMSRMPALSSYIVESVHA
jgi:flavin-dependent dehydrogenase